MANEYDTLSASIAEATSKSLDKQTAALSYLKQRQLARMDFREGLRKWQVWLMLAYQDIKLRYRRSVLGPFWLTISMAITVYSMGYLYALLFRASLAHYYPFLAAGMLGWSLISTIFLELTDGLITSEEMIKQIKLPYTLYIHRLAARNLLIFFHNMLVMIPIYIIFHDSVKLGWSLLLIIPGLLVIYFNAFFYGLILAMIGARYRDIPQIVKSLVQVVFFITPVLWSPDILNEHQRYLVDWNPFYAFLELIRAPLLGQIPTLHNTTMVIFTTIIGMYLSVKLFTHYRARIVYWL